MPATTPSIQNAKPVLAEWLLAAFPDAAQQARDFRRAAPTLLNSPVTPSGRRRHCRWPPWPQHPRHQRLAPCCHLAEQRLASFEPNGPQCIPQCLTMAINLRHVFSRRPLTEITPLSGNISLPCIQNELVLARFACRVSKQPCKPPFGNTLRGDLATKGRYFRPELLNHA